MPSAQASLERLHRGRDRADARRVRGARRRLRGRPLDLDACTAIGKLHALSIPAGLELDPARAHWARRTWPAPVIGRAPPAGLRALQPAAGGPRACRGAFTACPSAAAPALPVPRFASLRYGTRPTRNSGAAASAAIRHGADDEGEMGAYHHVHRPQRETNLRVRLDEYLRVGLEAGMFLRALKQASSEEPVMSGDYSRITFDPSQDDLGVLLQQGRPLSDADWNDLVCSFAGASTPARSIPSARPSCRRRRRMRSSIAIVGRQSRRSAAAACTSTACSPRTTAPVAELSGTRRSRKMIGRGRRSTIAPSRARSAALLPESAGAARRRSASRLSRRLAARGHAPRCDAESGRESGRRRQHDAPADRLAGQAARRRCRRGTAPRLLDGAASLDGRAPRRCGGTADHEHGDRARPTRSLPRSARRAATKASRTSSIASRSIAAASPRHGDVQMVARQCERRNARDAPASARPAHRRADAAKMRCCGSPTATGSRSPTTGANCTTGPASCGGSRVGNGVDDATRTILLERRCPPACFPSMRRTVPMRRDTRASNAGTSAARSSIRTATSSPISTRRERRRDHRSRGRRDVACCSSTASSPVSRSILRAANSAAATTGCSRRAAADATIEELDHAAAARHPPSLREARVRHVPGHDHRLPRVLASGDGRR